MTPQTRRRRNVPKEKGTAWESTVAAWLREQGLSYSRAPLAGTADRLDLVGPAGAGMLWGCKYRSRPHLRANGTPAPDRLSEAMGEAEAALSRLPAAERAETVAVQVLNWQGRATGRAHCVVHAGDLPELARRCGAGTCWLGSEPGGWERSFSSWAERAGLPYRSAPELSELASSELGADPSRLVLAIGTQAKVTAPRVVDGRAAPDRLAIAMGEAELMRAAVPRQLRDRVIPVKVLQRPGWEPGDSYAVIQLSDLAVIVRSARPLHERTGLAPLAS
ncbi:MAG TPA: hypothetical protein VGI05_26690 [Streptosporangiaceae bacterium]